MYTGGSVDLVGSDRLLGASNLPQEVSSVDVSAADDIMDEAANPIAHHFDDMIHASSEARREQLITQMNGPTSSAPASTPNDYWFLNQPATVPGQAAFVDAAVVTPGASPTATVVPQAAIPTADEQALVEKFKAEHAQMTQLANGHMKTLTPLPGHLGQPLQAAPVNVPTEPPKAIVTPTKQAAIINLAHNDDLDVATIARQAHKERGEDGTDEVVISLH